MLNYLATVSSGHQKRINQVAISADGDRFATASHDRTCQIRDVTTGAWIGSFLGHNGAVWSCDIMDNCVEASPRIATGCADGTLRIYNADNGEMTHEIPVGSTFNDGIRSVAYGGGGAYLALGTKEGVVWVIDCSGGIPFPSDQLPSSLKFDSPIKKVLFQTILHDDEYEVVLWVLCDDDDSLKCFQIKKPDGQNRDTSCSSLGKMVDEVHIPDCDVIEDFDYDGELLTVTGKIDGANDDEDNNDVESVVLRMKYNKDKKEILCCETLENCHIRSICARGNFVVCGEDGTAVVGKESTRQNRVLLFEVTQPKADIPSENLRPVFMGSGHHGPVLAVKLIKINKNGSYPCIVSGSDDSSLRVWTVDENNVK